MRRCTGVSCLRPVVARPSALRPSRQTPDDLARLMPMRSLKFAFRTLFRTPFVTAVAIVSLALGIGATAGIFSLFEQVVLQSAAVPDPSALGNLGAPGPKPGRESCSL